MKGYLKHLAAKASGTQPVVRPRVPSLFEPAPGAAAPHAVGVQVEDAEVEAAPPAAREIRTAAEPVARNPMAALTQWIEQGSERRGDPTVVVEPVRDTILERRIETRAEPTAAIAREVREPNPAPTRVEAVPARLEVIERLVPPSHPTPPVALARVASQPQEIRTLEHRETVREERTIVPPATVRPAATVSQPSLAHARAPVVAAPALAAKSAPQNLPHNPEPPPLRVTIGRIIVEATLPAPAPVALPPRPMPGPRLSLDDYLRQRGGRA